MQNWSPSVHLIRTLQYCLRPILIYCVYLKEFAEWRIFYHFPGGPALIESSIIFSYTLFFSAVFKRIWVQTMIHSCVLEMACFWHFGLFIDRAEIPFVYQFHQFSLSHFIYFLCGSARRVRHCHSRVSVYLPMYVRENLDL